MIPEIDSALRELLLRELPLRKGEVEISFDQPKRQWSSQLSRPTLNLYLVDIKENREFRGSEQLSREKNEDGTVTIRRNPVRIDLVYLVTGWTREVQDEHHLLSIVLLALLRTPFLPLPPDEIIEAALHHNRAEAFASLWLGRAGAAKVGLLLPESSTELVLRLCDAVGQGHERELGLFEAALGCGGPIFAELQQLADGWGVELHYAVQGDRN